MHRDRDSDRYAVDLKEHVWDGDRPWDVVEEEGVCALGCVDIEREVCVEGMLPCEDPLHQ